MPESSVLRRRTPAKPHLYYCTHRRRWVVRTFNGKHTEATQWRGLKSAVIAARDELPGQRELSLEVVR